MGHRVLLTAIGRSGHIEPLVGVVQHLISDGHTVAWAPSMITPDPEKAAELGVELLEPFVEPPDPDSEGDNFDKAWRMRRRAARLESLGPRVDHCRSVVRSFRPDVIVSEGLLYEWVIASALDGVRIANVNSSLLLAAPASFRFDHADEWEELADRRRAAFARYGLSPAMKYYECLSPWLNTVFATDAFLGAACEMPARTFAVGPSKRRTPRERAGAATLDGIALDRPLVYIAFGTLCPPPPSLVEQLVEEAVRLGGEVVLSAASSPGLELASPHVTVLPYAPQTALLERAALFVTHGGANSVMEALSYGVPMLVTPLASEQPVQAHFVTSARVGETLWPSEATALRVRGALERLIAVDAPARKRAAEVRRSYEAEDGAREAARLVIAAAG